MPAKVAKTDIENDVKATASEAEVKENKEEAAPKVPESESKVEEEKPEQMEVEESTPVVEPVKEDKAEDVPMDGPVVMEVTDTKELEDIPVSDSKPIVTEEKEKTEEKETDKMEAEAEKAEESSKLNGTAKVENGDASAPVAEETPPTVITEIEDISEKHDLADVGEIIDDLEPVVEEPTVVEDMEDLQNVGEVLEKECDEILSKVQDVTNLDNIPLKPLLNPIAEETMETENADSNDIVDRILDSELELEMKQCEDIDLNTVQEITEPKEVVEEKSETVETEVNEVKTEVPAVEEKTIEVVEEKNTTDGNALSSPTETETKIEEKITEDAKTEQKTVPETKVEESKEVESKEEESMAVEPIESVEKEVKESPKADSKEENSTPVTETVEKNENDKVPEVKDAEVKDNEVKEPQVNGKATNGNAETVNVNGDASKTEELNSRLSVEENGKKAVNGSNGDAVEEVGQGDSKAEPELADIKVKTVADVAGAGDEPRTDPIEQPTEA